MEAKYPGVNPAISTVLHPHYKVKYTLSRYAHSSTSCFESFVNEIHSTYVVLLFRGSLHLSRLAIVYSSPRYVPLSSFVAYSFASADWPELVADRFRRMMMTEQ